MSTREKTAGGANSKAPERNSVSDAQQSVSLNPSIKIQSSLHTPRQDPTETGRVVHLGESILVKNSLHSNNSGLYELKWDRNLNAQFA